MRRKSQPPTGPARRRPSQGRGGSAIRVLMTGPTPPPMNGMSVTTANLLAGMPGRGVEMHLVDTADRRGLGNIGRLDAANVAGALLHGARFALALLRVGPDVVYVPIAQNSLGFLRDSLFLLPARLCRRRVVVHLHGSAFRAFYAGASWPVRRLLRESLRHVTTAVVLGDSACDQFEGLIDRERIRVVENGVPDVAGDDLPTPSEPRLSESGGVVLFLGSLSVGKGFLDVLRSAALLGDLPGLSYVFAGEYRTSACREEAERLIATHGLQARVRMLGPVDSEEAQRLMLRAGVLVLPVRQVEGQPLVILEAFRCGTPVVASPTGCIPDTVQDGQDGLLVESGQPERLAEAIRRLATDGSLWARMSTAGRCRYEKRYTLEAWSAAMARVFREAAGDGRVVS